MNLLAILAFPIAAAVALTSVYLTALGVAALTAAPARPPRDHRSHRFAILVPAHDEAEVIERLLASLSVQTYPQSRFDVFVVADNCADDTASRARRAGAIVHERSDATLRSKGHALRWLLDRVRAHGEYDAYVVFDADSLVAPDFLERMDARLGTGSLAIQGHYRVLNSSESSVAALREAALASLHYLRPKGRAALGLSCGLKGNGMCFRADILHRYGWEGVGLAEDVEHHLALVRHGVRVDFAPEAVVRADMPVTLAQARSQNLRWEGGRLRTIREAALPLLGRGLLHRNPVAVDAAVEQMIPPLSVALGASVVAGMLGAAGGSGLVLGLAAIGGGGVVLHVFLGLVAVRAPRHLYRALLGAPAYILWKVGLYGRAAMLPKLQGWIRTERAPSEAITRDS